MSDMRAGQGQISSFSQRGRGPRGDRAAADMFEHQRGMSLAEMQLDVYIRGLLRVYRMAVDQARRALRVGTPDPVDITTPQGLNAALIRRVRSQTSEVPALVEEFESLVTEVVTRWHKLAPALQDPRRLDPPYEAPVEAVPGAGLDQVAPIETRTDPGAQRPEGHVRVHEGAPSQMVDPDTEDQTEDEPVPGDPGSGPTLA